MFNWYKFSIYHWLYCIRNFKNPFLNNFRMWMSIVVVFGCFFGTKITTLYGWLYSIHALCCLMIFYDGFKWLTYPIFGKPNIRQDRIYRIDDFSDFWNDYDKFMVSGYKAKFFLALALYFATTMYAFETWGVTLS